MQVLRVSLTIFLEKQKFLAKVLVIPYIITTFAVDLKNMGMPPNSNAEVNCTQHLSLNLIGIDK